MANETQNQDELNANGWKGSDSSGSNSGKAAESGHNGKFNRILLAIDNRHLCSSQDFKQTTDTPKENPFSFKHFLRSDTSTNSTLNHSQSNTNIANANPGTSSGSNSTQSPSKSATTSSLNSTGARPKIPQFQSVSVIHNEQQDSRMKRSPKFSSFDSQSSLSELADERIHGSRSNNSFNMEYQFPSSRSYSNYDIEPSSVVLERNERKQHGMSFVQRSQNNNSSNSILPDFLSDGPQDHLLMEYYDSPSANMSPLSGDDFAIGNGDLTNHQNGFDLTFNRSPNNRRRNNYQSIPLDLPTSHRPAANDLPPDLMDNRATSDVAVQREETYGPHNEPEITRDQANIDKMQTLPDFLSDGLIHSSGRGLADVATVSHNQEDNQSIIRLQQENDRLRLIIADMENQISQARNLETQYNVTLAESMEQVEENLFASNQKANKYRQQVKELTVNL